MIVTPLKWDTEFFGFPVATIQFDEETFIFDRLKEMTAGYRLVYVTSNKELTHPKLIYGDTKVLFGKQPEPLKTSVPVVDASADDLNELKEIGLQSGIHSRFALDPNFEKEKFKELYYEWVNASFSGRLAYKTLTVKQKGVSQGLLTVGHGETGESTIGLFAVADGSRGQGIGKALLSAADEISYACGDRILTVATQGKNKTACTVYLKHGFSIIKETYIYNYWNEAPTL